jgi:hypothetical protein
METKDKKCLGPKFESIPDELKDLDQWVCWRKKKRGNNSTKVPYNPNNGHKANVIRPATWGSFEQACSRYEKDDFDGIGIVLTKEDPFVGWDLDKCRKPETGAIELWAQEIIDGLRGYTEISPSGTGIRVFVKGSLPHGSRRNGKIEVYEDGRYLTLTGHRVDGTPLIVEDRQDELQQLHAAKISRKLSPTESGETSELNIDLLLEKAFKSEKGDEIRKLFDGHIPKIKSQSEADFALCRYLAFWLNSNIDAIDKAFRKSKLLRDKWDEQRGKFTYGERTIREAINATKLTYQDSLSAKIKPFIKAIDSWLCRVSYKFKKIQYTPITSFVIEPLESIYVKGEGEYLKVLLKNGKIKKEIILPPDCWNTNQKFLKILLSKEFTFTGSGPDVQLIREYTSTLHFQDKKGVRTAGFHDGFFITEEGAIDKDGPAQNIVLINDINSHCKIIDKDPVDQGDFSIIKKFNTAKIVTPLLGFAAATFFKPQIMKSFNQFPIMVIEGEAGAGKTSTVTEIVMRLWAMKNEPHSIGEQTKFSLLKLVNGSNSIPVIFEENKSVAQDYTTKRLISNLIRSSYNNLEGQRGRADQTLVTYYHQAPVIIAGETGFTEPAILDRTVPISMSKMDSTPFKDKFLGLKDIPFEKIGRSILQMSLEMPANKVEKALNEELKNVSKSLNDRPRYNAAVARFGLKILSEITGVEFDPNNIDRAIKENLFGSGKVRKSAVDKIIEAMSLMSAIKTIPDINQVEYAYYDHLESLNHYQTDDNYIRLHVAGAYPVFKKWAKAYDFEGDLLPEATFKKQLKKETYFVENKNARIGGKQKNTYTLDLKKMKKKGIEIADEWEEISF